MMKILLIGSRGCLGTEMLSLREEFKKKFTFLNPKRNILDINDYDNTLKYVKKNRPNIIINAASLVGINQCESDALGAFKINSVAVLNLSKICLKNNITFVHTSTHAVFDGKKINPYNEKDTVKINNIYAASKYMGEHFVENICKKYFIFRFPTMYGKRNNKLYGFVDKVIDKLKKNEKIYIAKDKIDSPSYAKHVAREVLNIIKSKKYGKYHISNKGKLSYLVFVKLLKKFLNSKSTIIPVKDAYFKSSAFKPLNTAIVSNHNIKTPDWKKALKEYIDNLNK